MAPQQVIRGLDVGYGNTKYIADDRGTCRLFPSLAPRSDERHTGTAPAMQQRKTVLVSVDECHYEVGPDSVLFPEAPLLHRDYIETKEYRALVCGALDAMQVSRVDLLVTGLPVYQHQARAGQLKALLTGAHTIRKGKIVEVVEVSVVAQPVGGLVAYAHENDSFAQAQGRVRAVIDPGLFSVDWLVTQGLLELPGHSHSIEGGVCEVLRAVACEINRAYSESYDNVRRIDEALRGVQPLMVRGTVVDIEALRPVADTAARQIVRRLRNHLLPIITDVEEIVLLGGGAEYFCTAVKDLFPGCGVSIATDPIYSNVRGFQLIGQILRKRRPA